MKVNEIIVEGSMKELQMIIDDAEAKAFDDAAPSKSAVHGNEVLKHAMRALKSLGYDSQKEKAAAQIINDYISKEYGNG